MQEDNLEQPEEYRDEPEAEEPERRRYFTRRNALFVGGAAALLIVLLGLLGVVLYRYGTFDNVIKAQFVAKMNAMGIDFTADVFRLTVSPLQLELKNATFNDIKTGEKLGFVRDARIVLSVDNLFAWQTTRDIKVESTEIFGAEVWVKYDEEGRSNFANIVQDQTASRVNLRYDSVRFSMRDSVIHFGDLRRTITADANNLQFSLEPESWEDPNTPRRYRLDVTSTDSNFTYQEGRM